MAARTKLCLVAACLALSACSTDEAGPVATKPKQPPALACAEQPLELPRPPTGGLPCELMPPTFAH